MASCQPCVIHKIRLKYIAYASQAKWLKQLVMSYREYKTHALSVL